jgi:hypothetical protein
MAGVPQPKIIGTLEWGARPPKNPPEFGDRPERIIVHGTDGHGPSGKPPREQGIAYARSLQRHHMDNKGWNDSGHHFLVMRTGIILVGRRYSLTTASSGRIVIGAHCPGQNDEWGIELEHHGADEKLTSRQITAYVKLAAWLCSRCRIRPTEQQPHGLYYDTDCPTRSILSLIPTLRAKVAAEINKHGREPA